MLIKKYAAETSKGDVAAGVAIGGGSLLAGKRIADKLSDLANKDMDRRQAMGLETGHMTPEEVARAEKAFKIKPDLKVVDVKNPENSFYHPSNAIRVGEDGMPVMRRYDSLRVTMPEFEGEVGEKLKDLETAFQNKDEKAVRTAKKSFEKAFNDSLTGTVSADKSSYAYLHELGHATGPASIRKDMSKVRKGLARLYSGLGAAGGAASKLHLQGLAAAARQAKKEQTGEDSASLRGADYLGRAATAANLFEEGQASARAIAKAHGLQGWKGARAAARHLAPAYLTYAAAPLADHILAPLAVKGAYALKRRVEE